MSQETVMQVLKDNRGVWLSAVAIADILAVPQSSILDNLFKLRRFNEVLFRRVSNLRGNLLFEYSYKETTTEKEQQKA